MENGKFIGIEHSDRYKNILRTAKSLRSAYIESGEELGGILVPFMRGTILERAHQDRNDIMQFYHSRLTTVDLPLVVTFRQSNYDNTYQVQGDPRIARVKAQHIGEFFLPQTHEITNIDPTFDIQDGSFLEDTPALQSARRSIVRKSAEDLTQEEITKILEAYDKHVQSPVGLAIVADLKTEIFHINTIQEQKVKLAVAKHVDGIRSGIFDLIDAVDMEAERVPDIIRLYSVFSSGSGRTEVEEAILLPHEKRLVIAPLKRKSRISRKKVADMNNAREATDSEWIEYTDSITKRLLRLLPQDQAEQLIRQVFP